MLLAGDGEVDLSTVRSALPQISEAPAGLTASGTLSERVERFERETLLAELNRCNYHVTNAAKALGLERSHLYKKAEQLGIDLQALRSSSANEKS
jgi:transcriptional regulator of acetoin/glycerol metabolism